MDGFILDSVRYLVHFVWMCDDLTLGMIYIYIYDSVPVVNKIWQTIVRFLQWMDTESKQVRMKYIRCYTITERFKVHIPK